MMETFSFYKSNTTFANGPSNLRKTLISSISTPQNLSTTFKEPLNSCSLNLSNLSLKQLQEFCLSCRSGISTAKTGNNHTDGFWQPYNKYLSKIQFILWTVCNFFRWVYKTFRKTRFHPLLKIVFFILYSRLYQVDQ